MKKKRRRDAFCFVAVLLSLSFFGCGSESDEGVHFRFAPGGISEIWKDGTELTAGTGGYYVIGSCDGVDDFETNVTSVGAEGYALESPLGVCPGAPFSIRLERVAENVVHARVRVGPLPVDYASLSVPLDLPDAIVSRYETEGPSLYFGGCDLFEKKRRSQGLFRNIPTPCEFGDGAVGLAETKRRVGWGTVRSDDVAITRTILNGRYRSLQFFRHTKLRVHNIEVSFGSVQRGRVVGFTEEIRVD